MAGVKQKLCWCYSRKLLSLKCIYPKRKQDFPECLLCRAWLWFRQEVRCRKQQHKWVCVSQVSLCEFDSGHVTLGKSIKMSGDLTVRQECVNTSELCMKQQQYFYWLNNKTSLCPSLLDLYSSASGESAWAEVHKQDFLDSVLLCKIKSLSAWLIKWWCMALFWSFIWGFFGALVNHIHCEVSFVVLSLSIQASPGSCLLAYAGQICSVWVLGTGK